MICALEFNGETGRRIEELGFPVYCLNSPAKCVWPQTTWRLYRLIRRIRPDVVHTANLDGDFHGVIAAKLARVPVIITEAIGTTRGRSRIMKKVDLLISKLADCVLAISPAVKRDICENEGIKLDKIHVSWNLLDLTTFSGPDNSKQLRRDYEINEEDIVLGIISRLHEMKGHRYIIKAVQHLLHNGIKRQLKLLIVGSGPLEIEIKQQIVSAGLKEIVVMPGMVTDVYSHLALMDIFVHPSLEEPFGQAIIEAMYMGLPVITTAAGGTADYMVDGQNGILVPPADIRALADAISQLADSPSMQKQLGKNAQETVKERFMPEPYVRRLESVYDKLLENSKFCRGKNVINSLADK